MYERIRQKSSFQSGVDEATILPGEYVKPTAVLQHCVSSVCGVGLSLTFAIDVYEQKTSLPIKYQLLPKKPVVTGSSRLLASERCSRDCIPFAIHCCCFWFVSVVVLLLITVVV